MLSDNALIGVRSEQDFKSPEEIRKVNLCGANLCGAKVDHTDFYLVDLRNAKYTSDQAEHFRRCGAILEARVYGTRGLKATKSCGQLASHHPASP